MIGGPRERRRFGPRLRARTFALLLALAALAVASVAGGAPRRVRDVAGLPLLRIPGGSFEPLYSSASEPLVLRVRPFLLMTRPVTNAEFLAFVERSVEYRRDLIARVFADAGYLVHWAAPGELGAAARAAQPVTRVSWFAAKAFCESHGLRLPSEAEWELAAAASETRRDARRDPEFSKRLLAWYATPNRTLPDVPHGAANVYGVHDLHEIVWEWVLDFNNAVVVADSRRQGENVRDQFCGGGALLAGDKSDYAAFMRYAMRGSLEAHYTTENLGFRCAADGALGEQGR